MYSKDFDVWNVEKKRINERRPEVFFHEREVWWAQLGVNVGYEQDGKNAAFVRPVLIIKKFNNSIFLAIPLSTKVKSNNRYYFAFRQHDNEEVAAVISQLRLLDSRRLKRKMYRIDMGVFDSIRSAVKDML